MTLAVSAYEIVLGVHVAAVVVAFGVAFAYPVMFAVTARADPRALPLMHRVEYSIERRLMNPALVVVLGAGIYLATDGHQWHHFYVQWGIAAIVVLGGLIGSVMIPTSKRAEELARQDLAAAEDDQVQMSEEYRAVVRRLNAVGTLLTLLVLATIFIMVVKPGG